MQATSETRNDRENNAGTTIVASTEESDREREEGNEPDQSGDGEKEEQEAEESSGEKP